MQNRVVRIGNGYPTGRGRGRLELRGSGRSFEAEPGDSVLWIIDPHSNVDSIISIYEKSSTSNIWSKEPDYQAGSNHWRGEISEDALDRARYRYGIRYNQGKDIYDDDPIISIRSSKKDWKKHLEGGSSLPWIVPLVGLFAISWLLWRKQKRKKNNPVQSSQ